MNAFGTTFAKCLSSSPVARTVVDILRHHMQGITGSLDLPQSRGPASAYPSRAFEVLTEADTLHIALESPLATVIYAE